MRIYVKSAGRKDTQDYVWMPVGFAADGSDAALLSLAERSAAPRGRTDSCVTELSGETACAALFFGNIPDGRTDFYGTPIFNRMALVFNPADASDVKAALNAAADWNSPDSAVEDLLASGVEAADGDSGFAPKPNFDEIFREIVSKPPLSPVARPNADTDLVEAILAAERAARPISCPAAGNVAVPVSVTPSDSKGKETQMKIFVNTVPSGEADYGWYVGGRPDSAGSLWKICEPVRAVTADTAFFAALSHEPGKWVLFLQDVVGRDSFTNRPARFTFAIEIPDSAPNAQDQARRLLSAWLHPVFLLPKLLTQFIDISGTEIKADEEKLLAAAQDVADNSPATLDHQPIGASRIWKRLSNDRSNLSELRNEASLFVDAHAFPSTGGVQFLFTCAPYSSNPLSPDAIPAIPARYVVTGFRADEADGVVPRQPTGRDLASPPNPGKSVLGKPIFVGGVILAAISAVLATLLTLRGCRKPPKNESLDDRPAPAAVTVQDNAPTSGVSNLKGQLP